MLPITTWYRLNPDWTYTYNHCTKGHTATGKTNFLHKNCYLDTSKKPPEVVEGAISIVTYRKD